MFVVGAFFLPLYNSLPKEANMSNKKSKKRLAIDKALEELGVTPVPPDHPIYKMGPSIRFISRIPKKGEKENE